MGKIEDMRRQREQQQSDNAARAAEAPKPIVATAPSQRAVTPMPVVARMPLSGLAADDPPQPTRPTRPSKAERASAAEDGKCPECGKVKPLQNGVMASLQKGFGKACAGSRKPPL